MTVENDDLEELAGEIRRLIKSNKEFLDRVTDDDYDGDDEGEGEESASDSDEELEEFEEL